MFLRMILCTAAASCITGIASFAQTNCDDQLISYNQWKETASTKWNLSLSSASGGQLTYYGARHTDEPGDVQFAEIKQLFDQSKPTIAFFEGPNRGIADSDTVTIAKFGESGYTRFLAGQAGIKAVSLEPPPSALYQYLVSKYDQEKVDLYFLLNEAMRLRTRKEYTKEQISRELETMLSKMPAILGKSPAIVSVAALETSFQKYWGTQLEWWQAKQEWFDPNQESAATGGIFTNDLNKLSSGFRNVYMYRLLAETVNKGEKVFAVIGRNHIPMQEAALKCAIR